MTKVELAVLSHTGVSRKSAHCGSVRLLEKHGFRRTETVRYGEHEHILLVLDEDR